MLFSLIYIFLKQYAFFPRPNAGFQRRDVIHEMIYLDMFLSWFREKARQWSADCKLEVYAFYLGLTFNQALRLGTLRRGGVGNLENCAYLWEITPGNSKCNKFPFFTECNNFWLIKLTIKMCNWKDMNFNRNFSHLPGGIPRPGWEKKTYGQSALYALLQFIINFHTDEKQM